MSFGTRLREARRARGITQDELARHVGVTPQAVSGWERDQGMPESAKVGAIAERIGRSADWLLEERTASQQQRLGRKLPVRGYVGASGEAHFYDMPEQDLDEIRAWEDDPPTAIAVEIRGKSLGRLFDRWYAVYDEVRRPLTDDLVGEVCVVGLSDGRVLIKQIQRVGGGYDLISNRDKDPPIKNAQIEWAAKVKNIRAR